jgi:DNA-binding CsgD family transcriptional regulator
MGQHVQFSGRESEIIRLLLQGQSNKQIALGLSVSVRTVEFHLSNIYAKLDVTSRTEAAVKLTELSLRESTGGDSRESTGSRVGETPDNNGTNFVPRRSLMKKPLVIMGSIGLGIALILTLFAVFLVLNAPVKGEAFGYIATVELPTEMLSTPTSTLAVPTETLAPTVSVKEHILEQIHQLAAEYERAVQAEKQNGEVEYRKDPISGENIFLFKDDSYGKILELNMRLWENIYQLNALYVQVYRDELAPIPFPTQNSPEERTAYYNFLVGQSDEYCAAVLNLHIDTAATLVYDPDDGNYRPIGIGDDYARCETYGQMIEEWRVAPLMEKVNQDADITLIRQVMGKPDLQLSFQAIQGIANAPGRSAALYADGTGTNYYVDIETARLAAIEPNYPTHPSITSTEAKSMDELRGIARQFASTNSIRLAELEPVLHREENCKVNICFFRWDYRDKDWSGTDWVMMPPLLQVGVLTNGQIATYINTLDLFE